MPVSRVLGIKRQEWGPDGNPFWGYPCFLQSTCTKQSEREREKAGLLRGLKSGRQRGWAGSMERRQDWALERQPRDLWELQRVSQPPRGSKQACSRPLATGANISQDFHATLCTSLGLRSAFPDTVTDCMSHSYQRWSTYYAQGTKPGKPGPPEQLII